MTHESDSERRFRIWDFGFRVLQELVSFGLPAKPSPSQNPKSEFPNPKFLIPKSEMSFSFHGATVSYVMRLENSPPRRRTIQEGYFNSSSRNLRASGSLLSPRYRTASFLCSTEGSLRAININFRTALFCFESPKARMSEPRIC
jgi:hypothetical protein